MLSAQGQILNHKRMCDSLNASLDLALQHCSQAACSCLSYKAHCQFLQICRSPLSKLTPIRLLWLLSEPGLRLGWGTDLCVLYGGFYTA